MRKYNRLRANEVKKAYTRHKESRMEDMPYWINEEGEINDWFSGVITDNLDVVTTLNVLHSENRHLKQQINYLERIRENNQEQIQVLESALKGYKTIESFVKEYVKQSEMLLE